MCYVTCSVLSVVVFVFLLTAIPPSYSANDPNSTNVVNSTEKHMDQFVSHGLYKGPGGNERAKNFIMPSVTGDNTTYIVPVTNTSDPFGILEIYPTLPNGEVWFFNAENPNDGQFNRNNETITRNADGSWHVEPGITRMLAFTKASQEPSAEIRESIPANYSRLAQVGHWYNESDWKNVEITGYIKVIPARGFHNISLANIISFVSRSIAHNPFVQHGCGGSAYHNNIDFDTGRFNFKKEMWHVDYAVTSDSNATLGNLVDKWIGFKGVVYNMANGSVKLESYIDKDSSNRWLKIAQLVDVGTWGNDMTQCGARTEGAVISWGSPMIIFKSNYVTYDFKYLSVREIIPP